MNFSESNQHFNMGFGQIQTIGGNGENGENGEDGATFIPSVSPEGELSWTNDKGLENPAPVNIKGKDGYTPVKGVDYFDGKNGQDGKDGHTPIKGTDYWTATDKAEMVNDVLNALPTWTGGSY